MSDRRIRLLLFLAVLVMTVLPLIASFYFLDRSLRTSLNLGFNNQIVHVLDSGSQNLKALKKLDAQHELQYREQFEQIETLKHVYSNPELVKGRVLSSLKIYFALGLAAAVALSILVAALLSGIIARAYSRTFDELNRQRDQVRYLEEISSWQELAKMLAHEIKNPLTPIELMITSLSKSHASKSPEEFLEHLRQTETMIGEELGHLKGVVNRFGEFARLPQVQLTCEPVGEVIARHLNAVGAIFDALEIHFDATQSAANSSVMIDSTLFRQVLMNIAKNAAQANPGRKVRLDIQVTGGERWVRIDLRNDGVPVPSELAARIFDPYVSGKSGNDNLGLGLAIVKKIVIEHGGQIAYVERDGRPVFSIALPRTG